MSAALETIHKSGDTNPSLDTLKDEDSVLFSLLSLPSSSLHGGSEGRDARLGRLLVKGRNPISTPNYIGITSRGVVPHLSQDTFAKHTRVGGVYVALEDFIENLPKKEPPLLKLYKHQQQRQQEEIDADQSALRKFISLAQDRLLILGARRTPAVPTPMPNSLASMSIYTSVGFQQLGAEDYVEMSAKLRPDIVVGLGDITYGKQPPGRRRLDKMSVRTERWTKQIWAAKQHQQTTKRGDGSSKKGLAAAVFAPVLPIEAEQQSIYLDTLSEDLAGAISGLALYHADSISCCCSRAALAHLPRLALTEAPTPHAVLREIELGMDLFTLPFIGAATDAGIALDFWFPAPTCSKEEEEGKEPLSSSSFSSTTTTTSPSAAAATAATAASTISAPDTEKRSEEKKEKTKTPLGIDMWHPHHAADVQPLSQGCTCFACTRHHRAYIAHLLHAKEMLAWVLLQIHNLHVLDCFFAGVRETISHSEFAHAVQQFARVYEPDLPDKTGRGPRVRGYQYKSEGPGETRRNPLAFERFTTTNNNSSSTLEQQQQQQQQQQALELPAALAPPPPPAVAMVADTAAAAAAVAEDDGEAADADAEELEQHGFAKRVE